MPEMQNYCTIRESQNNLYWKACLKVMQGNSALSWAPQILQTAAGDDRRSLDLTGQQESSGVILHQNHLVTTPVLVVWCSC